MSLLEIFIVAIGLSADAFAVAITLGLAFSQKKWQKALIVGLLFGAFQAIMPVLGYFLAMIFSSQIDAFGDWIAFGLLFLIGGKMIIDSLKNEENEENEKLQNEMSEMFLISLAFATSIDALAVGVSFAFLQVNIIFAIVLIGITTFTLSVLGVRIGGILGERFRAKANLAGGIILVLMGFRIIF